MRLNKLLTFPFFLLRRNFIYLAWIIIIDVICWEFGISLILSIYIINPFFISGLTHIRIILIVFKSREEIIHHNSIINNIVRIHWIFESLLFIFSRLRRFLCRLLLFLLLSISWICRNRIASIYLSSYFGCLLSSLSFLGRFTSFLWLLSWHSNILLLLLLISH